MKKLVIAVNTPAFFLSHRRYLAQYAKDNGYDVYILCPDGNETAEIASLGFKYKTFWINRKSTNIFSELKCFASIFKVLKEIQPDIYHGFTIKPVLYGIINSLILGVPKILATITGLGSSFLAKGMRAYVTKNIIGLLYRICGMSSKVKFIFQNNDDRALFITNGWVTESRAEVILGTGIDTEIFKPSSNKNERIKILFPARFLKDKGILELIEAGALLWKSHKNFVIQLCGRVDVGNPSSISQEFVDQWSALPFIEVLGFRKDMQTIHQQADIVCLPSYREGIPLALMEAASCGRPIVTTDAPGCREVVEDGVNGFLVPVGDSLALFERLKQLVESEFLRKKLGNESRSRVVKLFDKNIVLAQNLKLYGDNKDSSKAA